MISVEVLDSGKSVSRTVVTKFPFRIGRQSSNDLIVPLTHCPRLLCEIDQANSGYTIRHENTVQRLVDRHIITSGKIRVVIEDLRHLDDEVTREIDLSEINELNRRTTLAAAGFYALLVLQIVLSEYLSPFRKSGLDVIQPVILLTLISLAVTAGFSVLSRAINHQYEFAQLLRATLMLACFIPAIGQDLYGLRWILPGFFHYKEGYVIFWYFWGMAGLLVMTRIVFEHLSATIRLSISFGLVALIALLQFNDYLPFRDSFKYPTPESKSLTVIETFGSAVEIEQFLKDVDKSIDKLDDN